MSDYKRCTVCVMDNQGDATITFDKNGQCKYCQQAASLVKNLPEPGDDSKLKAVFDQIKLECKDQQYDCLIGVSGGLDSSYIVYLGHKYGLRMLGFHLDDGLDTPIAKENIRKLCEKTGLTLINMKPDREQYSDLTLSFLKASLPDLAVPQDNMILAAQMDAIQKYKMKYLLHGVNLSMESITFAGTSVSALDLTHIQAIQKQFSGKPINKLRLTNYFENILKRKLNKNISVIKPLNMIDYRMDTAIQELQDFCGYEYYGGKHHESVLCRFMQCWYLPEKFGVDKRKSHFSSLIVSKQMTRNEALEALERSGYPNQELLEADCNTLAAFFGISREEFDRLVAQPPRNHGEYPQSFFATKVVPFIIDFRHIFLKK